MKIIQEKTENMNYRTIIAFQLLLFLSGSLTAQNESETRSYMKNLPVNRNTSLEISNKYGNIYITPLDKDSAYIKAEVKAFAPNQAKLRKMFDGLNINISESNSLISASTDFTQNINMIFEEFKGMTNKLKLYESRVEINYYISIPEYLNLKITNKYGDVFIENCSGDFSISISNGSLKAGSLGKESDVSMTFCDATIRSIATGKVHTYFSEISIEETNDITINSISSRYDIKKAGEIRFESRRDRFFIGNIVSMKGNSYFTDFDIKTLKKDVNLITRYGNMNASLIEPGFETIEINSGYSDISLCFDETTSYSLDIRHVNTYLVLPSKNINTEQTSMNKEKKEYLINGTVGKNPGSSKVKINATRGNIYLK